MTLRKQSNSASAKARRKGDREQRSRILERDGHCCRRCFTGSGTHGDRVFYVHHVLGKNANPKLRHVDSNCVLLCFACHNWSHANPQAARELFGVMK